MRRCSSQSDVVNLTEVMYGPCVGVLTRSLVLEETKKEVFAKLGVGIEEDWPSGHDNVDGVHVLIAKISVRQF